MILKNWPRRCETMEPTAIGETLATNFPCDNEGAAQGLLEHFVSRPKVINAAHASKRFKEVLHPTEVFVLDCPKKTTELLSPTLVSTTVKQDGGPFHESGQL